MARDGRQDRRTAQRGRPPDPDARERAGARRRARSPRVEAAPRAATAHRTRRAQVFDANGDGAIEHWSYAHGGDSFETFKPPPSGTAGANVRKVGHPPPGTAPPPSTGGASHERACEHGRGRAPRARGVSTRRRGGRARRVPSGDDRRAGSARGLAGPDGVCGRRDTTERDGRPTIVAAVTPFAAGRVGRPHGSNAETGTVRCGIRVPRAC